MVHQLLSRLGLTSSRGVEDWVALSRSTSGYEREAAVHALAALRSGASIACLLARANDWVPAVSRAAQRALMGLLAAEHAAHWLACLEQVVALQRATRVDHSRLLAGLRALLGQPALLPMVQAAGANGSLAVRRWVFELQCSQLGEGRASEALLQDALQGDDIHTARQALQRGLGWQAGPARDALLVAAFQCRYAAIRADALRFALAQQPKQPGIETRLALCLDASATVRGIALTSVRGGVHEASLLLRAQERWHCRALSGRDRATALQLLLALCPADAERCLQAAQQDPSALLRGQAYACLMAAAVQEQKTALVLQAFRDPSGRVQRVALEGLRRGAWAPPAEEVLAIALGHGTPGSFSRGLAMMGYGSYWSRFLCGLRALAQPAEAAPQRWLAALATWTKEGARLAVTPSPAQAAELSRLWSEVAARLPEPLRGEIRFMLGVMGIHLAA